MSFLYDTYIPIYAPNLFLLMNNNFILDNDEGVSQIEIWQ